MQVLLLAQEAGVLKLGTISLDGTMVHADASRHHAVGSSGCWRWRRRCEPRSRELLKLSEQSDQREIPDGLVVGEEMARREDRLARLARAKAVLQACASERLAAKQAEYEAKLAQRAERERTTGRRPGGRPPAPPVPGPRDGDQYKFTDPESHIMKNATDAAFEQDYNAQVAVDQQSLLIVGWAPFSVFTRTTLKKPKPRWLPFHRPLACRRRRRWIRVCWPRDRDGVSKRGIEPSIATGRDPHHADWQQRFAPLSDPPPKRRTPGENGLQAQDGPGQSYLRCAQVYRRTGDRHHQGGDRLPPVLLARGTGGGWRVVPGLFVAATDLGTVVEMNSASAMTCTIPPSSQTPFPVGAIVSVAQMGIGVVTIVAGGGVTILAAAGTNVSTGQYTQMQLRQRALNIWVVGGDVT